MFRVAGLYLVGAWALVQIAALVFPAIAIPETAIRYVWTAVILAFPVAIAFGWRYDIKDGHIIKTCRSDEEFDASLQRSANSLYLVSGIGCRCSASA